MVVDLPLNAHKRRDQFFMVTRKVGTEWGFSVRWGKRLRASNEKIGLKATEKDHVLFFRGRCVSSRIYLMFCNIQKECLGRDLENVPEGLVRPIGQRR